MKQRNFPQPGQSRYFRNAARAANPAKSRSVSPFVYAASVCFLLQSTSFLGVFDKLVYGPSWPGKGGTIITMSVNLFGIFLAVFLFWSGSRRANTVGFNKSLALAAAGFLLISAAWSVDPRLSITQGVAYCFAVLGAIGLAQALDGDELMDILAWACGLAAVASVVWQQLFPEFDFSGIFTQKNVLGQVMAGGVLAALHSVRIRERGRFRYLCIIALCSVVAFLSKSSTAMVAIAAIFAVNFLGKFYLKGGPSRVLSIFLLIAGILAVIFFATNEELVYEFLGKDATMTGRTLIWPLVINNIFDKPLIGWGFSAFWVPSNPAAREIAEAVNWSAPNAHNGLLELLLEVGAVGTSLFLILWGRNFRMAMKCLNGPAREFGLTTVTLLIIILVIAISEEVLLAAQHIWTVLFFMTGFICEMQVRLDEARPAFPRPVSQRVMVSSGPRRSLRNSAGYDLQTCDQPSS